MTSSGIEITDVMRFFHGDGPQQEFESGEQKGGNAGCSACGSDARKYFHLSVSLSKPYLSQTDHLKKVLQGPAGRPRRNGGLKPFKDLLLEELKEECYARGLPVDGKKKPELQEIFKEEMGGIQRLPVMMFFDQDKTLEELNLGKYFFLQCTYDRKAASKHRKPEADKMYSLAQGAWPNFGLNNNAMRLQTWKMTTCINLKQWFLSFQLKRWIINHHPIYTAYEILL